MRKIFFVAVELNAGRTFCLVDIGALLKEVIGIILRNEDVEFDTNIVDLPLAFNTHGLFVLIIEWVQNGNTQHSQHLLGFGRLEQCTLNQA